MKDKKYNVFKNIKLYDKTKKKNLTFGGKRSLFFLLTCNKNSNKFEQLLLDFFMQINN